MKDTKSKIYQLMQTLSSSEMKNIRMHLQHQSSYPAEVLRLYDLLVKSIKSNSPFPSNPVIIQSLSKELSDQDVRLYKSYIVKTIENFWAQQELIQNEQLYRLLLSRAYIKKDILQLAQKEIDLSENILEDSDFNSSNYFLHKYMLSMESYHIHKNEQREGFDFERTFGLLDRFYLSERYRILTLLQNYKKILGNQFTDNVYDNIDQMVHSHPQFLETPIIKVYYDLYQILNDENNDEQFEKTFAYLKEHLHIFPKNELKDILLNLNNFCIRKINKGNPDFVLKSFEIFEIGINTSTILEKGYLSRFTFKNIVTLGIRLQKFDWTDRFIEDNYKLIEKKYQESSYSYNKAYLEYTLKNYDQAISLLQKADGDDVLIVLSARNLLAKIYYEKRYFDPLEYHLGSTAAYLRRRQLEKVYLDNYNNIFTCIRKLIQLNKLSSSQKKTIVERKENLSLLIQSMQPLTERKWLIEQLKLIPDAD